MSTALAQVAQPFSFDSLQQMAVVNGAIGDLQRVTFPLNATNRLHKHLKSQLSAESGISHLFTFRDPEDD